MKGQFLRAYRAEGQPDDGPIRFVASTEGIKRDGQDLDASRWDLDNYRKNPVFLWSHDYMGNLPIGRSDIQLGEETLIADVSFDQQDEFARKVESKYRRGFLNAVSVGWDDWARCPHCDAHVRQLWGIKVFRAKCPQCGGELPEDTEIWHELLDVSAVNVPGDPDALIERQRNALAAELDEAVPVTDAVLWERVAAAMAALMHPECAVPDADRKRLYVCLERAYGVCGRTAPEFRSLDELRALGDAEMRALFLEGEWDNPQVRVGAVLNSRNREALTQAQALIQTVLDSAKKQEESGDKPEEDDEGRQLGELLARMNRIGEK